ncbi:MAG: hypothetical protein H7263_05240 [Candidatus Sericytochromatia bacterium]|nr:hypothetical protein [Candidatus Sericytochromatia bacterium]
MLKKNIKYSLISLLLLTSINNIAYADEIKKAESQKIDIPESKKTDTKDDENKENDIKNKVKMGGRNISAFSRKGYTSGVALGGYFDTEFIAPLGGNSYFNQHHLILQASSLFNDRIFFNTEVEFESGGISDENRNGEVRIEQAFLDYKFSDWLNLRVGSLLIPVGRLNVLHDSDIRTTTARPLFSKTIIPSTWTESGLGFYGTAYPNEELEFNYELYVTQGINDKISDGLGLSEAKPSPASDNNAGKAVSTRVSLSPFIGLDFGLGGYYANYDDNNKKALGMIVGDFNYKLGAFELLGEGGFTAFNPVDQKDDKGKVTSVLNGPMWGYYLEGHYNFFPEFLKFSALGRDFTNPSITLFSRIDQVDTDSSKINNDRVQLCLGFNYRPITSVVFKFEYQINLQNDIIIKRDPTREKANNQFLASVAAGF